MSEQIAQQQDLFDEHSDQERIKELESALRRALPVVRLALYRNLAAHIHALLGEKRTANESNNN